MNENEFKLKIQQLSDENKSLSNQSSHQTLMRTDPTLNLDSTDELLLQESSYTQPAPWPVDVSLHKEQNKRSYPAEHRWPPPHIGQSKQRASDRRPNQVSKAYCPLRQVSKTDKRRIHVPEQANDIPIRILSFWYIKKRRVTPPKRTQAR